LTSSIARKLHRLLESGSRRIDFGRPAVRAGLALAALCAVLALAAAAWFAYLDARGVTLNVVEAREAYVRGIRAKLQDATENARAGSAPERQVGSLRLRIVVNRQGRLVSTSVAESSGSPALDELALRIVRESAPFERFPDKVRRTTRYIEIVSTFNFR